MKLLAFSDLHHSRARAEDIVAAGGDADLVIGAGDFCNMRQDLAGAMNLLAGLKTPMLAVPGNAESVGELADAAHAGTTVLHGEGTIVNGIRFFGMGGGVPPTPFGDWSWDLSEQAARLLLDRCDAADVLIVHSPPKGVADRTSRGQSVGSVAIREAVERLQPTLVLCGHIHDCWRERGRIGKSRVANLGPFVTTFEVAP